MPGPLSELYPSSMTNRLRSVETQVENGGVVSVGVWCTHTRNRGRPNSPDARAHSNPASTAIPKLLRFMFVLRIFERCG